MEILLASNNKNKHKELFKIFEESGSKHTLISDNHIPEVIEDKNTKFRNSNINFSEILEKTNGASIDWSNLDYENLKIEVDEKLKVNGLQNIRVVDASVMPEITSGNLNAPTLMIAERSADFIKNSN